MPDHRKHRGPHPEDRQNFSCECWPRLQSAVRDLQWLLSRGYAIVSSLQLVGDRHALVARQRMAVARSTASLQALGARQHTLMDQVDWFDAEVWIDGFNVITTIEAALSGGVILQCADKTYRDLASIHGSYRRVEETGPAIALIGETLQEYGVKQCRWLLDKPVSNSGRLKQILESLALTRGWDWQVELVQDPDAVLKSHPVVVASADSVILDPAGSWVNLAAEVVRRSVPGAWVIPMAEGSSDKCRK